MPEGVMRVSALLRELGHDQQIVMLPSTGKTSAEAAACLGCRGRDRQVDHVSPVFKLTPAQLQAMTGAPVVNVRQA